MATETVKTAGFLETLWARANGWKTILAWTAYSLCRLVWPEAQLPAVIQASSETIPPMVLIMIEWLAGIGVVHKLDKWFRKNAK